MQFTEKKSVIFFVMPNVWFVVLYSVLTYNISRE